MTVLHIADGLDLPADIVTQPIAILARRGAGKTYTATVIVEEVVAARIPVVILDPTGAWYGLRSSVDGKRPGLPVTIFGGDHGDVALEATDGRTIADVVLEHPGAFIVDLSAFESKRAEQRFAADFLERLYRGKKRETGPLLLVVDEADVFAPQRPMGDEQPRTLGALEAIVRRGRIKGLGDLLISQRAAVLNKNVLNMTEVLVAMQTTGPQDRAAIDDWISGNGSREERDAVLASLASLERGEAWVWSPSFLRILQRVRIRARTTFDSSRTPEAGETTVAPSAFADIDLDALGPRIAAAREKQKADDPRELRRRIVELERAAANAESQARIDADRAAAAPPVERIVEVPVLNGEVGELRVAIGELVDVGQRLVEIATHVGDAAAVIQSTGNGITAAIDRVATPLAARRSADTAIGQREAPRQSFARPDGDPDRPNTARSREPRANPEPGVSGDAPAEGIKLDAGARRMLSALNWFHPSPLTRIQLGTLCDLPAKGSTFRTYFSKLRVNGLIQETGALVGLTDAGLAMVAGEDRPSVPTTAELVEMWGRKLDLGARKMLDALVAVYPAGLQRDELGDRVALPPKGSTFRTYLSKLRSNQLVNDVGEQIVASEALFLGQH